MLKYVQGLFLGGGGGGGGNLDFGTKHLPLIEQNPEIYTDVHVTVHDNPNVIGVFNMINANIPYLPTVWLLGQSRFLVLNFLLSLFFFTVSCFFFFFFFLAFFVHVLRLLTW